MIDNKEKSADLLQLANCIRFLSIDAVQKAKSGHPGMPMGMADIATILYKDHIKFDPDNPKWIDRDRLIISNGHGSMLLYACLFLTGYKDINIEDIKNFRQLNSPTAGHPEYNELEGVETTTGPLSQGLANAVGFAISEKKLSTKFSSDLFNHYTYVFAGDGCLMEGLSHEACSLAGHLKLNKLIVFFDDNSISIDGSTNLSTSDNVKKRFESYGWDVLSIDGHNFDEISKAIIKSKNSEVPSLIACKTKIGFGSPNKESKSSSHGSPLGEEEVELTRKNLNWTSKPFDIPKILLQEWRNFSSRNRKTISKWNEVNKPTLNLDNFKKLYQKNIDKELSIAIQSFKNTHNKANTSCATRKASELSLELLNKHVNNLIGGSADLTGSNNTKTKEMNTLNSTNYDGNYIYYGVREHAMAAIMNGIALHGGLRPYGGTFLVFTDYCRPSIRLAALMNLPVIYVMTHDSIGLGEDGPTHQPVEHISSLRAIPNLNVIRPCDLIETIEAWETALESNNPSVLVLTRQNLPLIKRENCSKNKVKNGAYVVINFESYVATILATGSEVEIACEASNQLEKEGMYVRVVSMPSFELFEKQTDNYIKEVLGNKLCFAIEAGVINGWEKYVKSDHFVGMHSFGASAPYKDLYKHFGISSENLVKKIKKHLNK
ncbi:MAG: Transketolase 1 [Alphaproteobacteria bacterium MarineAlpha5_Bin5]|nr:MAG: Transketolase 1 [Alphaproteobacteria bacterium MarineAlpha5_Bin5]PPR52594.1 MAG: Transketolase 1 [Alphaproteobacteria bacterium MarineAlpha5_Bin4]